MGADAAIPSPGPEVSVVIPCLNEANSLGICIDKALRAFAEGALSGEVVVADNGSTDGSIEIAESHGARVVHVKQRGYGAALRAGIAASRGRYIVMGDADDSYDFLEVPQFVQQLRAGSDVVMGNRFRGGIKPGAMPKLHTNIFGATPDSLPPSSIYSFTWVSATAIAACGDSLARRL